MLFLGAALFGVALTQLVWPLALAVGVAGTIVFGGLLGLVLQLVARKQLLDELQAAVPGDHQCRSPLSARPGARGRAPQASTERTGPAPPARSPASPSAVGRQAWRLSLIAATKRRKQALEALSAADHGRAECGMRKNRGQIEAKYPRLIEELKTRCRQERDELEARRKRQSELSQRSARQRSGSCWPPTGSMACSMCGG